MSQAWLCRWTVGCFIVSFSIDVIAPCVQLAAVLHQLDVRVKDVRLWGYDWMLAAASNSFLEVKTSPQLR